MTIDIYNIPMILWVLPLVSAFLILLIGDRKIKSIVKYFAIFILIISLIFSFKLLSPVFIDGSIINVWVGNWIPQKQWAFGINFEIDALALFMIILILAVSILGMLFTFFSNIENKNLLNKFYAAWLILTGAMIGLTISGDLFSMYIMQEVITLSAIAILSINSEKIRLLDNSFKLLITSALTSILILIGICLIYIQIHTLNLAQVSTLMHNNYKDISLFAFSFIFSGFIGKIFIYTKLNMERSIESISGDIIFSLIKLVQFYGIIRIIFVIYSGTSIENLRRVLLFIGVIVIILGTITTWFSKSLRKFINYQLSIQTAYIITCFGMGLSSDKVSSIMGILGMLSYILIYSIFSSLLLMSTGYIINNTGTEKIEELKKIYKKMPFTVIMFLVGALSILGTPLFGGFAGKWFLYNSLKINEYNKLALIIAVTSIVNFVSFIKIILAFFAGDMSKNIEKVKKENPLMLIPMMIFAFGSIFIGVQQEVIFNKVLYPALYSIFNFSHYINSVFSANYLQNMLKDDVYELPQYFMNMGYDKMAALKLFIIILCFALLLTFIFNAKRINKVLLCNEKINRLYSKFISNNTVKKCIVVKENIINKYLLKALGTCKEKLLIFSKSMSSSFIVKKINGCFTNIYNDFIENEFGLNDQVICIISFLAVISLYMFFKML